MSEGLRNYAKQALDADAGEPAAGPSITMRYGNSLPEGVRPQEEPTADAEDGWEATLRYCEREWQQERAHMCRQIAELRAALKQREPAADAVEAAQVHTLAAMPCETVGEEDMENGCCRTCRARAAIAATPGVGERVAIVEWLRKGGHLSRKEAMLTPVLSNAATAIERGEHLPPAPAKD